MMRGPDLWFRLCVSFAGFFVFTEREREKVNDGITNSKNGDRSTIWYSEEICWQVGGTRKYRFASAHGSKGAPAYWTGAVGSSLERQAGSFISMINMPKFEVEIFSGKWRVKWNIFPLVPLVSLSFPWFPYFYQWKQSPHLFGVFGTPFALHCD